MNKNEENKRQNEVKLNRATAHHTPHRAPRTTHHTAHHAPRTTHRAPRTTHHAPIGGHGDGLVEARAPTLEVDLHVIDTCAQHDRLLLNYCNGAARGLAGSRTHLDVITPYLPTMHAYAMHLDVARRQDGLDSRLVVDMVDDTPTRINNRRGKRKKDKQESEEGRRGGQQ